MRDNTLLRRPCTAPAARWPHVLRALVVIVLAAACGDSSPSGTDSGDGGTPVGPGSTAPKWIDVAGDRQAPLPPQVPATTTLFTTSDACAQCHLAAEGTAVRDAKGRDVSAVGTWKASAMALAARDPYYLASFADELQFRPNLVKTVEGVCTRCHAPEASVELAVSGSAPTFAMLTVADPSKEAHLAGEGVACSLCHQITDENLGTFPSFTGGFSVGVLRQIFGPYTDPATDPMRTLVNYMPTYASHVARSALCATCHTVVTKPRDSKGNVGPDFPEQVPYLEWLASSYSNEGTPGDKAATCQDCHMPAIDQDGAELSVAIARKPDGLAPRKPFWRHTFAGANVQLSRFAATDPTWIGLPLTKDDHDAQAGAVEATLRGAATVEISGTSRNGEDVEIQVKVSNLTGHKFPTGYPSRRAFLHVKVGGIFESGRTDAFGRLVGPGDAIVESATFAPHLDVVDQPSQVQIYESVPVDVTGKIAHRPLDAHHYAKDNRLVPIGFNRKNSYSAYTAPVGTDGDPDWGSSDVVKYRVAKVPAGTPITVELCFQTVRPSDLEAFAAKPTPVARKLFDMATAAPPVPIVIATVSGAAP
jgi:hypothetical protein